MGRKVEARQTGVRNCRGGYGFTSCTSTAQTNAFLPSHGGYINVGLIQAAHPPRQHMCLEMQYSETMVAIIHGPAWLWWNGEHEVNVLAEVKAWLEISNRKSLVRYIYQTEMWFQTKKYAAEIPFERRLNGESAGVVEWALGEKVPVQGPDRWEGARMQRRDRWEGAHAETRIDNWEGAWMPDQTRQLLIPNPHSSPPVKHQRLTKVKRRSLRRRKGATAS